MAKRSPVDHKLTLKAIPVQFRNGERREACAEGNNAAWSCQCGTLLVGRCYYQFGDTCYTQCSGCGKTFRVNPDDRKRAVEVVEAA